MTSGSSQEVLEVRCGNTESCLTERGGVIVKVPREVFDSSGKVRERYKGSVLSDGVYVSACGNFYCSKQCWSNFCAD